jgi:hypothetical protein
LPAGALSSTYTALAKGRPGRLSMHLTPSCYSRGPSTCGASQLPVVPQRMFADERVGGG